MLRRAYGPAAWLIEDVDPISFAQRVAALGAEGVVEIVPTETTVLVRCDRAVHDDVGRRLDDLVAADMGVANLIETDAATAVIDVVYDGDDLDAVAARTGLGVDEVVERHVRGAYLVAFCGFSPGFAYLRGLDPSLHLPRRSTPRTSVPAGSVAIAAGYSCIYPSASPGGWHLLGRTTAVVWDVNATSPAALTPGTNVRFRPVTT